VGLQASSRLGPYPDPRPLGAGGYGRGCYRARDTKLERDVAIKVLPERLSSDEDARARFEREAKAVAALSHPNILAIHDFGTHDSSAYAVMELLEGEVLRERLAAGPLPAAQGARVGAADRQRSRRRARARDRPSRPEAGERLPDP
jgi:serine/threonine protein kinase